MLPQAKRLDSLLLSKPAIWLSSFIQRVPTPMTDSYNHQKRQNYYFKSKFIVLIALIILGANLLLSSLIFNVSNYSLFAESTKNLDIWLRLHRTFFQTKQFLSQFKLNGAKTLNLNGAKDSFYPNYSSTAYLHRLTEIVETETLLDQYMAKHPIDFHWADWIDTQQANAFIHAYDSLVDEFGGDEERLYSFMLDVCYKKLYDEKDAWVDSETYGQKLQVFEHLQIIGVCSAAFKYYWWTIPERISFETDHKYFDWPVNQVRRSQPYGAEGLAGVYFNKNHVSSSEMKAFEYNAKNRDKVAAELLASYNSRGFEVEDLSLKERTSQSADDFKQPNVDELIKKYKSIAEPRKAEQKYLDFLLYSKENVGKMHKFYFTFPKIQVDVRAELHHYNFPWIKQIITHEERIKVIHHMIRSWFKFAEHAGIISWFNYGNLIGWYFNAQNLPWDNDVDVQVSIADADKIGRLWNNTLVVENPEIGDAMYWLQTNPTYLQQNDAQFIDARYIDVKVGIYIDISALWITDRAMPSSIRPKEGEVAFHCKHYQWFTYSDIFPLRRTLYEGAQAYMPNAIDAILNRFYGQKATNDFNIFDHNWQPDIGIWVPNQVCEGEQVPPTSERFDKDGQLTLYGACNNTDLLKEWKHTHFAFEAHKKEFELISDGKDSSSLNEKDLPIFRFFDFADYQ